MSVRRTVAQSGAGLMLLAAIAFGPALAFGDTPVTPGGPGPSDGSCSQGANQDYTPTLTVTPQTVEPGQSVTLTVQCFPERDTPQVSVISEAGGESLPSEEIGPGADYAWEYPVPEEADPGTYSFQISSEKLNDNRQFEVTEPASEPVDPPTAPEPDPEEPTDPEPTDDVEPTPGEDDGQEPDDDAGSPGAGSDAGDGQGSDVGNGDGGNGPDNGDGQGQDGDAGGDGNSRDDSQQDGSSEDGDTSASAGDDDTASQDPAPQPPAAPGSATNDFPGSTPEPSADQQQSAALAVLMTSLFANGVSSGEVGATPAEARSVIDPSADASEIEVPAEGLSDAGDASEDGASSGASDDDALAATGSNLLVPAGIAGLAILAGAGLKIHQLRRER